MLRTMLDDLRTAEVDYPAVSILAPTHRRPPDNAQDALVVRNLIDDAERRMAQSVDDRVRAEIAEVLRALADSVDWSHTLDGIALFAGGDIATVEQLPFSPEARAVVDDNFATRDLVRAVDYATRYYVLVLSEKPTRLFEGLGDSLEEIVDAGFPMTDEGPRGTGTVAHRLRTSHAAHLDAKHQEFFRRVDRSLGEVMAMEALPLIAVGVGRYLSYFRDVSAHDDRVIGWIEGSHDRTPPHELAALVRPEVEAARAAGVKGALERLDEAVGAKRAALGLDDAWQAAVAHRVATLLAENGYHEPALRLDGGARVRAASETEAAAAGADGLDDAVDELVELVLAGGGEVVFVDDGALSDRGRIGAILRY